MDERQEFQLCAGSSMRGQCLIIGVIVPGFRGSFAWKLEDDHASGEGVAAFQSLAPIIKGDKLSAMLLEHREDAFFLGAFGVGIRDLFEIDDHKNR